jgi:hypothetical protein
MESIDFIRYCSRHDKSHSVSMNDLTCPPNFLLFNDLCYYVDLSFVSSVQSAERICSNQYRNSTLVKFNSHQWSNINGTRFLGRTHHDILLELFHYQLERQRPVSSTNSTTRKNWLRLLLGDTHEPNQCVLRYFTRVSGAFTTLHQCHHGGHTVCQSERITMARTRDNSLNNNNFTTHVNMIMSLSNETIKSNLSISSLLSDTTETTLSSSLNVNDSGHTSNTTDVAHCANCTMELPPDEDLWNIQTITKETRSTSTTMSTHRFLSNYYSSNYRSLIMILSGPLFAFALLLIGIVFLVRYVRRIHGSYSPRPTMILPLRRRNKRYSPRTSTETSDTTAVLYTRLKPTVTIDCESIHLSGNTTINDDSVQLLPCVFTSNVRHEQTIKDDTNESFHAVVKD